MEFKSETFLKIFRKIAVQYSDVVITDNEAISEYVFNEYNKDSRVIAYGGDHAWLNTEDVFTTRNYKSDYYLSVCRIEPENNVELILKTFSKLKYKIKFIEIGMAASLERNLGCIILTIQILK